MPPRAYVMSYEYMVCCFLPGIGCNSEFSCICRVRTCVVTILCLWLLVFKRKGIYRLLKRIRKLILSLQVRWVSNWKLLGDCQVLLSWLLWRIQEAVDWWDPHLSGHRKYKGSLAEVGTAKPLRSYSESHFESLSQPYKKSQALTLDVS